MAFTELELARIEKVVGALCRRRTRPELKQGLALEYRIKGHDVTLFERRPHWDGTPGHTEGGVARFKFTRQSGKWRVLWQRADLKWYAYEPRSGTGDLARLVRKWTRIPTGASLDRRHVTTRCS